MELRTSRCHRLSGTIACPPDKSITHRAYLLAALADGESSITSPLRSEDCDRTLDIVRALSCDVNQNGAVTIRGSLNDAHGEHALECGNSGTTIRLVSGIVAGLPGLQATLFGDESLSRRPMERIAEPLRRMGADVTGQTPPLRITGANLQGIDHDSPVASAQVKSCVLLAGLLAKGQTRVREPAHSRDHTERLLQATGVKISRHDGWIELEGGQRPEPFEITVPGDASSAAFWMVATAICGGEVRIEGVGCNPTRIGALDAMFAADVDLFRDQASSQLGEPVADIVVKGGRGLKAFELHSDMIPRAIDEIPILAVLATQCEGVSRFRDAAELRVKESDRLAAVATGLRQMGADVTELDDGLDISGPTKLRSAEIDARGDHRIAMAFAIAGLAAEGETGVSGAEAIATSYPGFVDDLENLCA